MIRYVFMSVIYTFRVIQSMDSTLYPPKAYTISTIPTNTRTPSNDNNSHYRQQNLPLDKAYSSRVATITEASVWSVPANGIRFLGTLDAFEAVLTNPPLAFLAVADSRTPVDASGIALNALLRRGWGRGWGWRFVVVGESRRGDDEEGNEDEEIHVEDPDVGFGVKLSVQIRRLVDE
jgi:hypothetical protein